MNELITLPDGWRWTTLGEVTIPSQKRVKPKEFPDYPYIGMENITPHTMQLLTTIPAKEMKSTADTFEPGDVLYGRLRPYLNKVYCPDFKGLCSTEFIVFRKASGLSNKYLQFFLNSNDFVSYSNSLNAGDRPRVKFNQFKNYPFPLPPLPEQERIVAKIEELFTQLDAGTAALRRVQAGLRRYKASVLKAAVEGNLVPQDQTDESVRNLFQKEIKNPFYGNNFLPYRWEWVEVNQVGEIVTGCTPRKNKPEYYGHDYPFYKPTDLNTGYETQKSQDGLSSLGIKKARFIPAKSVLVTCLGATIGKTGLIRVAGATNQQINAIIPNNHIVPEYLYYVCISPQFQKSILDNASATTLPIINKRRFERLHLPLPPLSEQYRIVEKLDQVLTTAENIENLLSQNLIRSKRLRQIILTNAFEGKLI